jgi:hypothetical protein
MIRRIYSQATENDCFVAAVSGLAYIYPEVYGDGYADGPARLDGFLERTREQMRRMDLRTVHIHHHGPYGGTSPETLARYARALKPAETDLIYVGYGKHDWFPDDTGQPQWVEGVPVVYACTQGHPNDVIPQIAQAAGRQRPAFVCAHITPWKFKPGDWKTRFDELGTEFILVTPEELGQLARQANSRH